MRHPLVKANETKGSVIEGPLRHIMKWLVQSRLAMIDIVYKNQVRAAKESIQETAATTTADSQTTPMTTTWRTMKANPKANVRHLESRGV